MTPSTQQVHKTEKKVCTNIIPTVIYCFKMLFVFSLETNSSLKQYRIKIINLLLFLITEYTYFYVIQLLNYKLKQIYPVNNISYNITIYYIIH